MRFSLIHVGQGSDEATVVVPGALDKTVVCVPIGALPAFLPLLAEATTDLPEARCDACGTCLPGDPDERADRS